MAWGKPLAPLCHTKSSLPFLLVLLVRLGNVHRQSVFNVLFPLLAAKRPWTLHKNLEITRSALVYADGDLLQLWPGNHIGR